MSLSLNLTSISDIYVRENLKIIQDTLNAMSSVVGLNFISSQIALTDTQITHNLGFTPKDLIQTRWENPDVAINWLFDKFDDKFLYFQFVNPPVSPGSTKYGLNILVGRLS